MNIFKIFWDRIAAILTDLQREGHLDADAKLDSFIVEPPRDVSHGDLASNAAMVLAKGARTTPKALAELIIQRLVQDEDIEQATIAGPGFINISLKKEIWPKVIRDVLIDEEHYGASQIGAGQAVNIEYVSVNPTGPIHVGHTRGAVFGDALANLLAFAGYRPTREFYINDAGGQIETLTRSAYLRYLEALGETIEEIPQGLYPGDYLIPVGQSLAKTFGKELIEKNETERLSLIRDHVVQAMLAMIKDDLVLLGIKHDVFFSERTLITADKNEVANTIEFLKLKGLIYQGRLDPPKGKLPDDWEDREQTLFRATEFGDDTDRALIKSDGTYTYFAGDIAYHRNKIDRGFYDLINVLGADHSGYVKRITAAVKALSDGKANLDVKICQIVRLFKSGEIVKMSKRSGQLVTLRELVEEVGPGPVRFMMLYRKNDAMLDFDFDKVLEQSNENPVFYVQYAHARACSALSKAADAFLDMDFSSNALARSRLSLLTDHSEIAIMKKIAEFPRIIEAAASAHEPHRVAFYAHDLASSLHSLWTRGKELPQLRFIIQDSRDISQARIALVAATAYVLRAAFSILGVQAIAEMR